MARPIRAQADGERSVTLSEALRNRRMIRGEDDAEANQVLADAFGEDECLFALRRALRTWIDAPASAGATLIPSPNAEFLNFFRRGPMTGVCQAEPGEAGAENIAAMER